MPTEYVLTEWILCALSCLDRTVCVVIGVDADAGVLVRRAEYERVRR